MTPASQAAQIITDWWAHQQEEQSAHACTRKCLEPMIAAALTHAEARVWEEAATNIETLCNPNDCDGACIYQFKAREFRHRATQAEGA